ncbi:G-protein coupled receptors family 1 profile domain-containing protein [Caenorhabditis elegans]|uniref:G-protein coupled receptors family 1 profile domain-containing protein n=1 Tax=Caenorhabditis elegans TaxID=6239 RepID=Q9XU61_CAEEL|nr:G-protein coupled receptors family 1 profile domain-containing protein [Caenorhabditis elegans]CAB05641.2 G-protein coupled receptors family 1 profile domain-containing protein [Caenorhabditis elegans]|eukprot:NP_507209.2 Serpentine Receptor, class W [Caenorhabditis elegans]
MNEELLNLFEQIARLVLDIQFLVSIVGFILTLPHLFILTRKSMRTSSTNSIMTGIAIIDLVVLLQVILERGLWFLTHDSPCINLHSFIFEMFFWIGDFLRDTGERASFWMGVFLVLVRLLITKIPESTERLSSYAFGYLIFILMLTVHSLISYSYYREYHLEDSTWLPGEECTEYPEGYIEKGYIRNVQDQDNYSAIIEDYKFNDGMSKILISILYPVLAIFLIFDIRKSARIASAAHSEKNAKERYHSGRMILLMTIFYTITSAPGGISDFIQIYCQVPTHSIMTIIIAYGSIFLSALFCLNSASHCLINFSMSTNYRKAAKMVFFANRKQMNTSVLPINF